MQTDDLMKKAIKNRQSKGFDITITVSPPEDDKKSDLAPQGEQVIDAESGEGDMPSKLGADQTNPEDEMNPEHPDEDQDKALFEQMMSQMSDYDKGQVSKNPKGLQEMAMNNKMKQYSKGQ